MKILGVILIFLIVCVSDIHIMRRQYWKTFFCAQSRRKAALVYLRRVNVNKKIKSIILSALNIVAGFVYSISHVILLLLLILLAYEFL